MSNVLVIGDGRLARDFAEQAGRHGHAVASFFFTSSASAPSQVAEALPVLLARLSGLVDITVEAVISSKEIKQQVLAVLDDALPEECVILPATLNASATEVGGWTGRASHVVGWAALPPLEQSSVFEVFAGLRSAPAAIEEALAFLESCGRTPVQVSDAVGGVLPRVVASLVNEAALALMEGVADAEDIDKAMRLGTNYPYGPLAWGDLIGLDQVLGTLQALGDAYGRERYQVAEILRQLVRAGFWGQESGRGFYQYT